MSEVTAQSVYATYEVLKSRVTQPVPSDYVRFRQGNYRLREKNACDEACRSNK